MGHENEYTFEESNDHKVKKSKFSGVGSFIWNSRTKEFLGRDGASWGKVSLFYAIFYLGLGSFFIGMLAVFIQIMPKDKPTYYGESSVMNSRGLNPGLGFRPQVDVEDSLIYYNPQVYEDTTQGHKKYVRNLKNFLDAKYPKEDGDLVNAIDCEANKTDASLLKEGKYCKFDYEKIFADSPCTEAKKFGYETDKACVLIKLNKIVSWQPNTDSGYISVRCDGEGSADKDNVKSVIYHSEGHIGDSNEGRIDAKYFPFYSQKGYKAPFVWAQIEVPSDTLVNIECKAYALNIDHERLNRRGMTKFSLFVTKKK